MIAMTAILLDTNVLIYAYDRSEPEKQQCALQVVDSLARSGAGRLSAQVLSEFFVNITRKLAVPLNLTQANERLEYYVQLWPVYDVTSEVILEAIQGVRKYQLSFWDAQIWAAARLNQVGVIFSEDFNPGAVIEGVQFVNPFAEDFQPEEWGL